MKKLLFITLAAIAFSCYGQKEIENGMRGSEVRAAINDNFDTLYNFNDSYVNPVDFGATGDGVTDDWQAFQDAIDVAAAEAKEVIIPAGTYRIDSEIYNDEFGRDHPCIIRGQGYVKLDFTNMNVAQSAFEFKSQPGAGAALTQDAAKGDTLIVTDLTGVVRGDVLHIISDTLWGRTVGIYKRELLKARRVSNDTIFLYTPLYDSYDAAGCEVNNTNAAILRIENLELSGNANQFQNAFTFAYFRDIYIRNVVTQDFDNIGFACSGIFGGSILDCTATEQTRAGFGYGISMQICQNITLSNNRIYGARHAIEMGITTRAIIVQNCFVYAAADFDYPMDCHESCEYLTFRNNFVYGGGFYMRGLNYSLDNNRIFMTKAGGAAIGMVLYGYTPRVNEFVDITNNKVINLGGSSYYSIQCKFWYQNDTIRRLNISNNQFTGDTHCIFFNMDIDTYPGNYIEEIQFTDNHITQTNPSWSAIFMSDSIQYNKVYIHGGSYTSAGSGIAIAGGTGTGDIYLNDVYIKSGRYPFACNNSKLQNVYIKDSHLIGGGSGYFLWLDIADYFLFKDNIVQGMDDGGLYIERASTFLNDGNLYQNNTGTINDNATTTITGTNW